MDVDASAPQEEQEVPEDQEGGIRVGDIYIPPPPPPACTFDTTGPRLLITRIENINFKSYAGHQELGPFHKNFTAIVGPNGSGKSNVIDAMLFVFGYRAQKIRSKKVGVLIHNSDHYPDLQSCSVRVHFQMIVDKGPHEFEPVPGSDFTIGRSAFKDNSSVYEINGKRAQFKEVGKLLRSYGIDLDHNRFLILQGEIEMIAMMKPKGGESDSGMLEYLEDIIGCNRYIEPIQKLSARVDELSELRLEKINRVKSVEKEKQEVESARNEALEFMKLENKITRLENILLHIKLQGSESELEVVVADRDKVKEKLSALSEKQDEVKCIQIAKEKEYDEIRVQCEKTALSSEKCELEFSELERQDVTCRENINVYRAKVKKLVKNLEAEEEKLKDLQKQPLVHEGEASELRRKKEILERKKEAEESKLQEVMKSMEKETKELNEQKDKLEAELMKLKTVLNEAKAEMDLAQSELDIVMSAEKNEQTKLQNLEEQLEQTSASLKEKKRLHEEAESRIPKAEEKIKNLKNLLLQVTEKEAKISEEVKVKRVKVEEAKASLNAHRSRSTVLQSLLQQKECGTIPGILGRLGDLGAIDEKYDVAISTACGRLDNIVTDTINTAQKCVEYLKRNNKGYATFIALDKMQRWVPYIQRKFSAPENVPRLFDLIRVQDERVLPAFYFALQDTLVTENLSQATRIGLHGKTRYRCVTLRGEVVDIAGTMSGGGGKAKRGGMGQSVATCDVGAKEIERMSQNLDELIKASADLRSEKGNLEECITQTQRELTALQHALKKNSMEFKSLQENQVSLAKQIELQKPKVRAAAPDKKKVDHLQSTLEKATKSYEKADSAASKVDEKVQSVHAEIITLTKGRIASVRKNVNKITKEIDTVHANITKCTVAAKTAARNAKKTEDKIQSLQGEIAEAKQSRDQLMLELKHLEEKAAKVFTLRDELKKEAKEWEEKKKEISRAMGQVREDALKLKSESIEIKNELKSKEAVVKEKSDTVKHLKLKLSKLELQVIDDDEEEQTTTLPTFTAEQLAEMHPTQINFEIGALQSQMSKMKPNMSALAEYRKKLELYQKKLSELEEITKQRDEMKKYHDSLRKQRLEEFMKGFKIISAKLKEVYQMITLGGDAELELVDSLDPFTEGIVFSVRPPKKSWKNIGNLSGGEKTLSSLALVFALHYYKPTPFYVMDEIDAALDFKNVSIVGNYIKERTKNAQFIIISLRNNMFELADRLVGIYKTHNCTESATISPHEIACDGGGDEEEEAAHNGHAENGTAELQPEAPDAT